MSRISLSNLLLLEVFCPKSWHFEFVAPDMVGVMGPRKLYTRCWYPQLTGISLGEFLKKEQ